MRRARARALIHSPLRTNWFEPDEGQFEPTIAYRHIDWQGRLCLLDDGAFVSQIVRPGSAGRTSNRMLIALGLPGLGYGATCASMGVTGSGFSFCDGDVCVHELVVSGLPTYTAAYAFLEPVEEGEDALGADPSTGSTGQGNFQNRTQGLPGGTGSFTIAWGPPNQRCTGLSVSFPACPPGCS